MFLVRIIYNSCIQIKRLCFFFRQWYPAQSTDIDTLPSVKSLSKTKYEPGKRANRRVAMLNKVFMKQITDLMSTGTVSMDIVGRGIEISKVQVTPDYQSVRVFWVCKGTATDEETESVLKRTSGILRHELSTLSVMGQVPYITFVKDKQEANVVELDRILSVADYGDDYEQTQIGHLLKTEFTLNTRLSEEMKAKIKQLEAEIPLEDDPVPEMTHNVYGLDHDKILSRLVAARKKIRDAWDNVDVNGDNTVISYRSSAVKPVEDNLSNQREELADFLLKRQIMQNKLRKQMRNDREQLQIQYELLTDQTQDVDDESDVYSDDDEDDYLDYEEVKMPSIDRPDKLS
ncbi:unnamed protein product [Diatraea saccharalis]|uniref:Ribosome-binding factor A, mitochondrial n=1 Tax=Diatraea saccharalis TaxID=40085 RepID=A0A9P0C846_9NEOP|nr:unnamed protein product [Diatraea saccharalis]